MWVGYRLLITLLFYGIIYFCVHLVTDNEFEYVYCPDAELAELPVDGLADVEVPGVRGDSELGLGDALPKLYTGDVVAGSEDGELVMVYLFQGLMNDGISVVSLDTGLHRLMSRDQLRATLLQLDEVVLYEAVVQELDSWGSTVSLERDQLPDTEELGR